MQQQLVQKDKTDQLLSPFQKRERDPYFDTRSFDRVADRRFY